MPNRLYVGNLPYSVTESDLANFFASAGKVEKASMVIDRDTGKPRGFGFVDMASDEEAKKAIETLHGADMQGRSLIVNEARPKEDRPRPSGGGHKPYAGSPRPHRGHQGGRGNGDSEYDGYGSGGRPGSGFGGGRGNSRGKNDWRTDRRQANRRRYEDEQF